MRSQVRESWLAPQHFVLPLFIHDLKEARDVKSLPGCRVMGLDDLKREVEGAMQDGIRAIELFPDIDVALKTERGEQAYNPDDIVMRSLRELKALFPELTLVTDVALDPYSSMGHDGIVRLGHNGEVDVLNDETIAQLCKQAVAQAEAGADIVAPSDMMDGRVGAIRDSLDAAGHSNVSILSYTAKYASGFYGPFREAQKSSPKFGDKKTYQMDYYNTREALREVQLDEEEGADIVMVKPAGAYLDIIKMLRENTSLPVAAYQVSGEYAMLKAVSERGWLDERAVAMESLVAIRRAGADMIFTYYARQASRWIKEDQQAGRV
jgi:porphobilinogen synthase